MYCQHHQNHHKPYCVIIFTLVTTTMITVIVIMVLIIMIVTTNKIIIIIIVVAFIIIFYIFYRAGWCHWWWSHLLRPASHQNKTGKLCNHDWNRYTAHPVVCEWNHLFLSQLVSDRATLYQGSMWKLYMYIMCGPHCSISLISFRFWLSNAAQCGCWPHEGANCITGQSLVSAALSLTCTFTPIPLSPPPQLTWSSLPPRICLSLFFLRFFYALTKCFRPNNLQG